MVSDLRISPRKNPSLADRRHSNPECFEPAGSTIQGLSFDGGYQDERRGLLVEATVHPRTH